MSSKQLAMVKAKGSPKNLNSGGYLNRAKLQSLFKAQGFSTPANLTSKSKQQKKNGSFSGCMAESQREDPDRSGKQQDVESLVTFCGGTKDRPL